MQRKHAFQPATPDPLEERLVLSAGKLSSLEAVRSLALSPEVQFRHVERLAPPHSHDQRSLSLSPGVQSRHVPHSIAADHGAVRSPAVKLATASRPFQNPPLPPPTVDSMGDTTYTMDFGGLTRSYLVHVPAGYNGTSPLPLVLAFHGGAGNSQSMRTETGLDTTSNQNGFLVVYPDGTGASSHKFWDAGITGVSAVNNHVDDVGFVNALLNALPQTYNIDQTRVYATGFSNGAMLTYLLAEQLANRITAIAPVAGGMLLGSTVPSRQIPIIDFHGMMDELTPFYGGTDPVLGVQSPPMPTVIAQWAQANNDDPVPVTSTGNGYSLSDYEPDPGQTGAPVEFYSLPNGGHTWPGGVDMTPELDTGRVIHSVNASALIWNFFKKFTL